MTPEDPTRRPQTNRRDDRRPQPHRNPPRPGPRARPGGRRFRQLDPAARAAYLEHLERGRAGRAFAALEAVAKLAYYGDDGVMRVLGYDAEAVVARGRDLRLREGRW